jgi:GNAT superfamily N-acetyltransferase
MLGEKQRMLKLETVTKENFKDVPGYCKQCLYWQTTDTDKKKSRNQAEIAKQKRLLRVQRSLGISSYIAYTDTTPVGFVQLASSRYFPRLKEYTNATPSEDAVFLACLYIPQKENQDKGYGTKMLKSLITELKQRGFRAIETFARRSSSENPSGPLGFYLKNGFKTRHNGTDFPLVRLGLV